MPGFTQIPNDYVFDDPLWTSEPQTKGSAHSDLYRLAQFKPGLVNKRGNLIELEPGQIGWSMVELSKRWKAHSFRGWCACCIAKSSFLGCHGFKPHQNNLLF